MERVKINLPETILFSSQFIIQLADINYANHMGNERILVFTNSIRIIFFAHLNLLENDATSKLGIIVANHSINYKNEGFLNDEITCQVGVNNITECSFDLIFHFLKTTDKTLAIVRTGCVYYDYTQRKIHPLPADYLQIFKQ